MSKALKNLIGVLAALALLPIALKTVSTSVGWVASYIQYIEARRAKAEHQKELMRTNCTAKGRFQRARELQGKPPPSPPADYVGPARVRAATHWIAVELNTESEQDCLERARNLTGEK